MKLEELLSIAYAATNRFAQGSIFMSTNKSCNMPKYMQTYTLQVQPFNNKLPRKHESGGTVVSSATGYKELIVWVYFGDNSAWSGPHLKWLYMDRSQKWDGERDEGDEGKLEELYKISDMLDTEAKRIFDIEMEYSGEHGNLEGLVFEDYVQ